MLSRNPFQKGHLLFAAVLALEPRSLGRLETSSGRYSEAVAEARLGGDSVEHLEL